MWTVNANFGQSIFALVNFPQAASKKPRAGKRTLGETLGRLGSLEVRLARGKKELRKAQRLRYEVFYKEGGAIPDARTAFTRRDADRFDKFCDHLIVIDHAAQTRRGRIKPKIVGAYRLMRDDMARKAGGFYSEGEYDVAPLLSRHAGKRALELGRSCVLAPYRGKRTIELLWRGLLAYVRGHDIDVMFGCASLHGANPLAHAQSLSYLAHYAPAEENWRVSAREELHTPMRMLARDAFDARKARDALSPLIKGYLRVGARFGDGAVVDRKFNTTDVFVVMPVADIDARYLEFFGGASHRRAA
ncbi:MAG: GNAT family N-acetyltransferase [Methylocystis sp.]